MQFRVLELRGRIGGKNSGFASDGFVDGSVHAFSGRFPLFLASGAFQIGMDFWTDFSNDAGPILGGLDDPETAQDNPKTAQNDFKTA